MMTNMEEFSHWNYRVVRKLNQEHDVEGTLLDEVYEFTIHEVYYNHEGTPRAWSTEPDTPYGESVEELADDLRRMQEAFTRPVLKYTEMPGV